MKITRVVCLLVLVPAAFAQTPRLEERLPPNTSFYLLWRGAAALGPSRQTNPLLRLWDSPDFAPVRRAFTENAYTKIKRGPKAATLTPEVLADVSSLLENPFVVAYIGAPPLPPSLPGFASGSQQHFSPLGSVTVYDTAGKTELHQRLRNLWLNDPGEQHTITRYALGTITVEKVTSPQGINYQAYVGNYFLSSESKETLEDLVTRFDSERPPADTLAKAPDVQRFRREFSPGTVVEFFARMPDWKAIHIPPKPGFDLSAFLRSLHLERIYALGGALAFQANTTRLQMTLLGDPSPGSLLDAAGASGPAFATLAAVPSGGSFSIMRVDFSALYQLLRQAIIAALPPEQSARVDMLEAVLARQLGMPPRDALKLLSGEFATVWVEAAADPSADLYVASIEQPAEVLRLLRTALANQIWTEEQEAGTTYLTVAMPYTDPKTQSERRRFFVLAVTPKVLLFGLHKAVLRGAVARLSGAAGASATADAQFIHARVRLPERLTGLSYADLTHVEWQKLLSSLAAQAAKDNPNSQPPDWLKQLSPAVFPRYLHSTVSGWWKDRDGIHFDGYIE